MSENSQFLSRHIPNGHYHSVKWSQRVKSGGKRETFPLFLRHDVINFLLLFCSPQTMEKLFLRLVFFIFNLFFFRIKGKEGMEEKCLLSRQRHPFVSLFEQRNEDVCSTGEVYEEEYIISNLIWIARVFCSFSFSPFPRWLLRSWEEAGKFLHKTENFFHP